MLPVSIFGGIQTLPDQRLAASGLKRRTAFTVPQFTAAVHAVIGTHLIEQQYLNELPLRLTEAQL